ncbi:hypothetical protein AVEN_218007-1, partial [Araneus ventricosus]
MARLPSGDPLTRPRLADGRRHRRCPPSVHWSGRPPLIETPAALPFSTHANKVTLFIPSNE